VQHLAECDWAGLITSFCRELGCTAFLGWWLSASGSIISASLKLITRVTLLVLECLSNVSPWSTMQRRQLAAQVSYYICPLCHGAPQLAQNGARSCLKCFLLWWFMGSVWLVWLIGVSTHVHDRHIMFDSRYNKLNRNGKTYLTIHSCGPWYWIEIIIVA
jgi:hypothetical protein